MSQVIAPSLQENKNRFVILPIKQINVWGDIKKKEVSNLIAE